MKKFLLGAGATAAMLHSGFALSQVAAAAAGAASGATDATENLQSVIVTGTRTQGLKAIDSAAPVQVIDSGSLKRTGQTDLIQALAQNVPSFTAQAVGGDTANLTLSARLRGLSPNDTLVLVNGKRRHGTANLAVLGGPYQGGAAADLNYIPVSAIDHIEVLQDGAAAQYGTDAIAGVVNIILKTNSHGGSVSGTGGGYLIDGGGRTGSVSGNIGFEPIENGYINLSAESRYHGFSNRGNIDPRLLPENLPTYGASAANTKGFPYTNRISGDAAYHLNVFTLNSGYEFNNGAEVYNTITYGHKDAEAFENYRTPNRTADLAVNPYPNGFNPEEALTEDDYGFTLGIKGTVLGDWRWDISSTWGRDDAKFNTLNTINFALAALGNNEANFYDGMLRAAQWTNNADISRDFNVGWAKPITLSLGAEHRKDSYKITQGDFGSTFSGGGSSYPGFLNTDAGSHSRTNYAFYGDVAVSPIAPLNLDGAVRYEHFDDFGSTWVGKLTGRYDVTEAVAFRGTVSNGFRAPTLAEEYYRSTNVGPTTTFAQFAPNSIGASFLGINGLKPERSTNYSAGIVLKPATNTSVALDAYQITIRDRIVGSGQVYGIAGGKVVDPNILNAITANGNVIDPAALGPNGSVGVNVFGNLADTRSRGVEGLMTLAADYGQYGRVDWSVAGTYNRVSVQKLHDISATLTSGILFDRAARSFLEEASPKFRVNAGALWRSGDWTVNFRETLYGPSANWELNTDLDPAVWYKNSISSKFITDIEVSKLLVKNLTLAVGANNLFNTYPNQKNADLVRGYQAAGDNAGVEKYPNFSPFGINGGFYYARVTYAF